MASRDLQRGGENAGRLQIRRKGKDMAKKVGNPHDLCTWDEDADCGSCPDHYQLSPVYPSPFNAETNIEFTLRDPGNVSIQIYNERGQLVKVLIDQQLDAGSHSIRFNANDLVSGIYFVNMEVNGFTETKKMVLTK